MVETATGMCLSQVAIEAAIRYVPYSSCFHLSLPVRRLATQIDTGPSVIRPFTDS
jgi:hypothetical protein